MLSPMLLAAAVAANSVTLPIVGYYSWNWGTGSEGSAGELEPATTARTIAFAFL